MESNITILTSIVYFVDGVLNIVPRKVHVNTASAEEKDEFKKRSNKYLWTLNTKRRKGKTLP